MSRLAIFDLDHTLLAGDSDHLWGAFLVERGLVDGEVYARENDRFYAEYQAGTLDIHAYAAFAFEPLVRLGHQRLEPLRRQFVEQQIQPIIAPGAPALLDRHRAEGDTVVITTATNAFVTQPIAELLGVEHLIATDPEQDETGFTGRIAGTPNFRDGKVVRLQVPMMSQEQRDKMAGRVKELAEQARVTVRNIRRDQNKVVEAARKSSELSEDNERDAKDEIQDEIDDHS